MGTERLRKLCLRTYASLGMPCRSGGWELILSLPKDQVQSLVEEARSCKFLGVAKKNVKEKLIHLFTKGFPLPALATSHLCTGSTLNIVACVPIPTLPLWPHPRFIMTLFSSGYQPGILRTLTQHSGWPIPIRQGSTVKLKSVHCDCVVMISHLGFVCSCLQILFIWMALLGHVASKVRGILSLHVRKSRLRESGWFWPRSQS